MRLNSMNEKQTAESGRLGRELWGLFAVFCGLLLVLSLASFDGRDPWLNHVISGGVNKVYNKAGLFGAYTAGFLYDVVGVSAWIAPLFFCLIGARRILGFGEWAWWRWGGFVLLTFCLSLAGAAHDLGAVEFFSRIPSGQGAASNMSTHGGGVIGHVLYAGLVGWLSPSGTLLLWIFCLILAVQMLTGLSWKSLAGSVAMLAQNAFLALLESRRRRVKRAEKKETAQLRAIPTHAVPLETKESAGYGDTQSPPVEEDSLEWAEAPAKAMTRPTDGQNDLIHPLLQRTVPIRSAFDSDLDDAPSNSAKDDRERAPEALHLSGARLAMPDGVDEEEDLPPWVRDFEQGRLGAPSTVPSVTAQAASLPVPEQGRTETAEAYAAPAVATNAAAEDTRSMPATLSSEKADAADSGFAGSSEIISPNGEAETPRKESGTQEQGDAVPIFETPPIESAAPEAVGLVRTVLRHVKKPPRVALPPLDLLAAPAASSKGMSRHLLEEKGASLMTCLTDFGIQGELVGITPGPVVTMFEVRPAPGVRVSRIANLSDDLALALKAVAVRIQAPVPGTDTVGIEIPNEARETVYLRELLGSRTFKESRSLLTLALGKTISGLPAVTDLATMPHLLMAGATGAGKSVGINSIILSLLYKARPEEVKLLLVDPKRVEMAIYADLPHLVHPVVTEMHQAKNALEWAVAEMERRYNDIARASVRNIADYNAKLASWGTTPPEGLDDLAFMPYLLVIIDELADLMLVASKEVETSIVRLAQLARAAGIHLILATQRPSVDVVTGLIKANFPCRISYQVTSKHDSRTILDSVGAEHLLGRGDMLFKPGGGKFQRMHGAFVSDAEVQAVVDYWRSRQRPDYQVDFSDWAPEGAAAHNGSGGGGYSDIAADPLYNEAVEFVRQQGKASISLIQRKFRIGFNKAARFVEQMEQDGIIGPADGSKPRLVIR